MSRAEADEEFFPTSLRRSRLACGIFLATLLWTASCSLWRAESDAKIEPGVVHFLDVDGQVRSFDLSHPPARLTVFVLFSPGFHCGSCFQTVQNWDLSLAGWPSEEVQGFIVGEGSKVNQADLSLYREGRGLQSPVLLDETDQLRQALRLPSGPLAVGLTREGAVVFQLPVTRPLGGGPEGRDLIERILSASLAGL